MQVVPMSTFQPRADRASDPEPLPTDPSALWVAFGPPLRAFLARRVPPGVEADDLVQDVFLRVIRSLPTLRRTERPEAWLFQIARNALRDALRARLRRDARTETLDADAAGDPERARSGGAQDDVDRAAEAELAPCLTAMVDRLSEPYRTAIALTSIQGVSQAEAARRLGLSSSGMKSRMQRGRARLREMLVACCAITVDGRGGVSDFHLRAPGACASPSDPCGTSGCGSVTTGASIGRDARLQERGRE